MENFVNNRVKAQVRVFSFKNIKAFLVPVFIGLFISFLFSFLLSLIFSKFSFIFPGLLSFFSLVSLIIGAFVSGFVSVNFKKHHGLLVGCFSGFLIFFVISFVGIVVFKNTFTVFSLVKLLLLILFGALGGIVSVNKK